VLSTDLTSRVTYLNPVAQAPRQTIILKEETTGFYGGRTLTRGVNIHNDMTFPAKLTLRWALVGKDGSAIVDAASTTFDLQPAELKRYSVEVALPEVKETLEATWRVELLDGVSGAVLDSQTLSNFCGGKYLVWDVSGWVQVRVTPLVKNAVVSGVFFDEVAGPVVPSRIVSISLSSEGVAQVVVVGTKGSTYYLEASDDLATWSRVGTNVNVEGTVLLVDDGTASQRPIRFFRAVEAP